jgi:ssDNA-binding Zn-finger/Zn-ribbon topoisomerase 1
MYRKFNMTLPSRTFRVFVSSTFSDLEAERNALQKDVFPRLRDLAAESQCRFQAIDLRWGVSGEASLDQQAMNICLGEIDRCQKVSPRPNFIVLLGDRYGWCPPPSQIPEEEFKQILGMITQEEDKALLNEWYILDKNAVPGEWRLKARERKGKYEKPDAWQPVESRLQAILAKAAGKLDLTPERRLPYIASATEQEINAGALSVKDADEHVFCFCRSIDGLPQQFNASEFLALVGARLKEEYQGVLNKSCEDHVKAILEMGLDSSAKDFANHLQQALKQTPKATPEEEVVNVIQQVLVDITAKDFENLDEKEWTVDEAAHTKQNDLKKRLQKVVPKNVKSYKARWTGDTITRDHIDQMCEDVYSSLERIILGEIQHPHEILTAEKKVPHIQPDKMLDDEGLTHHKFAEERLRFFVGRTQMLVKIAGYLTKSERRSLAIVGAGGTGKSALMAKAIQQTQKEHPKAEIVYRFIGATPGSSDGRSLLDSLCHEISRRYGKDVADIPTDYRDLVPELGKRMQLASADRPLILFLDSLDQLSPSQDARSLIWLPAELPEHASVIASTRPEEPLKALQAKQAREEVLVGLSPEEGDDLLCQWLKSVQRTLQAAQRKEVLDKFIQSEGNPLYLKLAFEEARLWTSASGKPPKKQLASGSDKDPEQLAPGVKGIIEKNMIERLKDEGNHGEALVSHALGYLAASRYGLAEDELVDLLSRDQQVYEWFFKKSYHVPADLVESATQYQFNHLSGSDKGKGQYRKDEERAALAWLKEISNAPKKVADFLKEVLTKADGPRLPVVLWSRLSFDLAPYLTERMVDGSSLLNFYHRELGDVSTEVFLSSGKDRPYHARLADYFRFKADPKADQSWTGKSPHGLSELPYHLTKATRFEEVYKTLIDFKFLEHKAAEVGMQERKDEKGNPVKTYTGVLQLQDDLEQALATIPGEGGAGIGDRAPLIITAVDSGKDLSVYCPICNKTSPIKKEALDTVIACPQEGCKTPLKVNPFVIHRS